MCHRGISSRGEPGKRKQRKTGEPVTFASRREKAPPWGQIILQGAKLTVFANPDPVGASSAGQGKGGKIGEREKKVRHAH